MQTGWVGSNAFRILKAIQVCSLRTQRAAKGGETEIRRVENLHVWRCRSLLDCPSNALVQLQAHYHDCGETASERACQLQRSLASIAASAQSDEARDHHPSRIIVKFARKSGLTTTSPVALSVYSPGLPGDIERRSGGSE